MERLIGISGKAGSGKSTLAKFLLEKGLVSTWRDLGDEVKRECSSRFGFPLEWAYDPSGKERFVNHPDLPNRCLRVRNILQWWGTDIMRETDPGHWINKLNSWVEVKRPQSLVVADLRFIEEAQWVLDRGGWLFRVEPYEGWKPGIGANHKSETELDSWQQWHLVIQPPYGRLNVMANLICRVVPRWEELVAEKQIPTRELAKEFVQVGASQKVTGEVNAE